MDFLIHYISSWPFFYESQDSSFNNLEESGANSFHYALEACWMTLALLNTPSLIYLIGLL